VRDVHFMILVSTRPHLTLLIMSLASETICARVLTSSGFKEASLPPLGRL
jgi:hypothetical protein